MARLQHADLVDPSCRDSPVPARRPKKPCLKRKGAWKCRFSRYSYALAEETGSAAAEKSSRRTARAICDSDLEGKPGPQVASPYARDKLARLGL
jgi:hypothetical protein